MLHHPTFANAKLECRALGYSLTRRDGEYRVSNGSENTAYYTNDIEDAIGTAHAMFRASLIAIVS